MKNRALGRTGLVVSEICFGTMTSGGDGFGRVIGAQDQSTADLLVRRAFDGGVNFFNTANVYADGLAERIPGEAVRRRCRCTTPSRGATSSARCCPSRRARGSQSSPGAPSRAACCRAGSAATARRPRAPAVRASTSKVDRARAYDGIDAMPPMAEARGVSVARIALAWMLHRPSVTSVIIGAKTEAQLVDNLAATEVSRIETEVAALDAASALPSEYPGWMLDRQGSDHLGQVNPRR